MKQQLIGALRNITIIPIVILLGLSIYSIFLLRGRDVLCEGPVDPLWRIVSKIDTTKYDSTQPSEHLAYTLTELINSRYERKISNRSWRPFLVTMYEFKDWRYSLPDEKLLRYASRYVVRNKRTDLKIDSGIGFDCGSGLGMTLIRPWETFVDTVGLEELMPRVFFRNQLAFLESGKAFDHLTGTAIGDPQGDLAQYDAASLMTMVPDDELEMRLYLPVIDYFNGKLARVYANGLSVGRWKLLEREMEEMARIRAEVVD